MNFYKGIFGRWVSGFGLLMALSGSVLAQGPWEFNGDLSDWVVKNSTMTAGTYSADFNISGSNKNNNRIRVIENIDTSSANPILAITLKNTTANASLVFALTTGGGDSGYGFKRVSDVPANASTFSTYYYDLSQHAKWTGSSTITSMYLRFKTSGSGTATSLGNIYIDRIELLAAEPSSSPSISITSSTSGVTDGSTTSDSSIGLVFTLSEDTTGFTESDIAVTGGTIDTGSFSGSGITYTATFTPSGAGATTVNVNANAFTGTTSSAGNSAAAEFNWTLAAGDSTAPVISLVGDQVVEVALDGSYSDAGATATDDIDGTITGSIATTNNVDTSTAGTYTVTYNVSDDAGNSATAVIRTVIVAPFNFDNSKDGWSGGSSPLQ